MQITINININDRIINFFKKLLTKKNAVAAFLVTVIATTLFLYATPITKQFTFSDGSTASTSEVNSNFDDLFTKVNELDTTVSGLQTGANPVYGNASGAGNDSIYVDASGNVGIGTTDIEAWRSTVDAIEGKASGIVFVNDTYGIRLVNNVYDDGTWKYKGNGAGSMLTLGNTGAALFQVTNETGTTDAVVSSWVPALFVANSGNVGIGVTDPGSYHASGDNLVIGDTTSSGNGITIVANTSGSSGIYFADGTGAGAINAGMILYDHQQDAMRFFTNAGGENMFISTTGAIGIGTVNPSARLHVNGGLCVTSDDNCAVVPGNGIINAEGAMLTSAD